MADKILQNEETFNALLSDVVCRMGEMDFEFIIRNRKGDYSLQIQFDAKDNTNPASKVERQYCRIWPLQVTMCDSEVIRTAWKASEAAIMHELEECFKFQNKMIYSPHMNVHKLVELRRNADASQTRIAETGEASAKFGTSIKVTLE